MKANIGNYPKNGAERKISVKLDKWDTWNADTTLAIIAAPLLISFKELTHGAPLVDDEDVPDNLKSTSAPEKENEWSVDDNHFERWHWVLDEMIYAMQQISNHNEDEDKYFDHSEVEESSSFQDQISAIKIDNEGLLQYQKRVNNGCRLFGKYFQNLWS